MQHSTLWIAGPPHLRYSALKIAFPDSAAAQAGPECGVDDLTGYLRWCFSSVVT